MDPSRILIACQGPARESFTKEIQTLFKSVNLFGGKLSHAKKVVYFTEPVDSQVLQNLKSLGVKVEIIDNAYNRIVHANKIQILLFTQKEDFDLLISLDTDVVITDDFSSLINETKIGASIEAVDPLGIKRWKNIFQYFNVTFPSNREITSFSDEKIIPYFNSGVLLIPKIHSTKLLESWQFFINRLINIVEEVPIISENSFYIDQIALTLAMHYSRLPYYWLPLSMNFSTHIGSHKDNKRSEPFQIKYRQSVSTMRPYIIHHHHRLTKSGFVRYCYYDNINRVIDSLNLSLKNMSKDSMNYVNTKTEWLQNTDLDDPEMLVDGLYLEILQRPADKAGLEHFATLLENKKMSIQDIRKALLSSDEHKALTALEETHTESDDINKKYPKGTNPQNEARTIVHELYIDILQRPADKAGLEHFATLLENKKMHVQDIRQALLNSEEYKTLKGSNDLCFGYDPITKNHIKLVFPSYDNSDILLQLINTSRRYFGWFTKHYPRLCEYPWIAKKMPQVRNKMILDIGTGISPMPLYLAENGAKVITVDNNKTVKKLNNNASWNEWGFLDYSELNQNITSINYDIERTDFPNNYFDYIYSVSVIEHIKASIRRIIWKKIGNWTKSEGILLLSLDLIRGTNNILNWGDHNVDIEEVDLHGSLRDIEKEIIGEGFELIDREIFRDFPHYIKVDVAFLSFRKIWKEIKG
ncbi:MAG: DUF4214 domain-containing protein [Nitrosopumilaceae archaeon]